ncbi:MULTISPECIES: ABC1 kinase family protein [Gordonibacter]|uniref:AarF/UbiB family protein n=1 Tax=Gordonibacter faecis TaxID=3047475 RepID=A0ABT7DPF8_9ACTN|nr:AarF/UbiB family protein [Gordonibacter sp. KGMB12511]MDJ1651435.1 AarF/UbiB family protein [Gordonibacter sp. KGMB12511]HIW76027.1 AarF/ABC1/UbiB kinase family protein [Candidatus Gordonibacter avicola]
MPTFREVAQVAVEARRDKGAHSGRRLREIERILRRHHVLKGLTPYEATSLLEDLGPTFVKMGQIAANRSDVIPPAYAEAFKRLRADVPPMPYSQVIATVEVSLGHPWRETFSCIEERPLGSASIAQVHRARIAPDGPWVAVKVRRPHVVEQMTQDLALIRRAVALIGLTRATDGIKLSLEDLVTELERTTRQELDFRVELRNLERFRTLLADQPGVESPRPYPLISSDDVLVMDFIEGPMINDIPALCARGLDPRELGHRLAESYVTQIVDNGFFHADPHPGNLLVSDGDIVWIDLGMVGLLSPVERGLVGKMLRAAAENDPYALMQALLTATREDGPVDHGRLLDQLGQLVASYATANLASINVGQALLDVFDVLRSQNLAMPPSFTLLARGMVTIEGVLVDIAPDESVIDIIADHVRRRERTWESMETKAREFMSIALSSTESAVRLPTQASHTLDMVNRGQVKVGAELGIPTDVLAALYSVSGTVAMALISAGLFVGSSLLAQTNMHPQFLGVPFLAVFGYVGAFVLAAYVVWRNLLIRHRQKSEERL